MCSLCNKAPCSGVQNDVLLYAVNLQERNFKRPSLKLSLGQTSQLVLGIAIKIVQFYAWQFPTIFQ